MRTMAFVIGLASAATMTLAADTLPIGLPSSSLTPGDARKVTKEQICAPGYAASIKVTKESTKEEAFSRYGLRDGKSTTEVLDHLIPIELGGTDSIENLWPEPAHGQWNATQKDALEQKMLGMVCDGTLTVKQAQSAMKKNWVLAYQQYVAPVAVATKDQ
ncbi:MAG: hypothetical protein JWL71_4546 [Acidobacteria bacterium]|jgi:hypothetical protein|nr:hypothetical protein [Acidobacteriota bacterium]